MLKSVEAFLNKDLEKKQVTFSLNRMKRVS